jgi:hypothetical protein
MAVTGLSLRTPTLFVGQVFNLPILRVWQVENLPH